MIFGEIPGTRGFAARIMAFTASHDVISGEMHSGDVLYEFACACCEKVNFKPIWISSGLSAEVVGKYVVVRDSELSIYCEEFVVWAIKRKGEFGIDKKRVYCIQSWR